MAKINLLPKAQRIDRVLGGIHKANVSLWLRPLGLYKAHETVKPVKILTKHYIQSMDFELFKAIVYEGEFANFL